MRLKITLLICLIAGTSSLGWTQWVPVIAKQRMTIEVWNADGSLAESKTSEAMYYRRSSGSTLIQYYTLADGKVTPTSGQLQDYDATHKLYNIDYSRKEAVEGRDLPSKRILQNPPQQTLGQETINGIPCVILPSMFVAADGTKQQVGRSWHSVENQLLIKDDSTMVQDGSRRHEVIELYDISLGRSQIPSCFR